MSRKYSAQSVVTPTNPAVIPHPVPEIAPPQLAAKLVVTRNYDALAAPTITKQAIRERAYQIYLARNGAPGDSESDWLAAEAELRAGIKR